MLHLFNRPVAIGAHAAGRQMCTMAEEHKTGNFIAPPPFDLALFLCIGRQSLNRRTINLHVLMTLHAHCRRRQPHSFTRVRVSVAGRAFQSLRARVQLVTERNGLRRRGRRLFFRLGDGGEKTCRSHTTQPDRRFQSHHKSPLRSCSAMYSEARIESDIIVRVGFCLLDQTFNFGRIGSMSLAPSAIVGRSPLHLK